ncbi:nucleotidyl transferase AbiEii/AbiGii toxin family protein [Achromobacter sp. NPDC008082]|uniref:nucleotidyl transferase AbiEii/AbiGii toxin family protein n=1 Tax=Achromobacter sp. NPDC008082 TaxID=3363888 RepID=UPI0036EC4876
MLPSFLQQPSGDRREALQYGSDQSGRLPDLLEKDVWVVWGLQTIYGSHLGPSLTFKGGTSLSKAHKIIDRFSEDVDLTYDIRRLIPAHTESGAIPATASQEKKWRARIDVLLPEWIKSEFIPTLQSALTAQQLTAEIKPFAGAGKGEDKVLLRYQSALDASDSAYVQPAVLFEFGARATGEPHAVMPVSCDLAGVDALNRQFNFPTAAPLVMSLSRTFWEKATAAHVYCLQARLRGERYARHWYDLAEIYRHPSQAVFDDHAVAVLVATHKSRFYAEKDVAGIPINYHDAVGGSLTLIPEGAALVTLRDDFERMTDAGLLAENAAGFDDIMTVCAEIQSHANQVFSRPKT